MCDFSCFPIKICGKRCWKVEYHFFPVEIQGVFQQFSNILWKTPWKLLYLNIWKASVSISAHRSFFAVLPKKEYYGNLRHNDKSDRPFIWASSQGSTPNIHAFWELSLRYAPLFSFYLHKTKLFLFFSPNPQKFSKWNRQMCIFML